MNLNKQKLYLENRTYLLGLNDDELITKIIEENDYISIIYEKYKESFPKQLASRNRDIDYQTIQDIFLDSLYDLLNKILLKEQTILEEDNSSLSQYFFVICINNVNEERKTHTKKYLKVDFENQYDFNNDDLEDIFSDQPQFKAQPQTLLSSRGSIDEKTGNMVKALEIMKTKGGKCYSLIVLSLSTNYKYKMRDLRKLFNYKTVDSTKNQKSKCIQRFKKIYFKFQLT